MTTVQKKISSSLINCRDREFNTGLFCDYTGPSGWKCMWNTKWCRDDDSLQSCKVDGTILHSNDSDLCQDNLFWRNQDCNVDYERGLQSYGVRCKGTKQHCMGAWYHLEGGQSYPETNALQTCLDNSDEVMFQHLACPGIQVFVQLHNDLWPANWIDGPTYDAYAHENYYNDSTFYDDDWHSGNESDDPHRCQHSCSNPEVGCSSCTNKEYFHCPLSGLCLHPDLLCDGHPQCPFSEDETIDICFERWVASNFVSSFASLKCSSERKIPRYQHSEHSL